MTGRRDRDRTPRAVARASGPPAWTVAATRVTAVAALTAAALAAQPLVHAALDALSAPFGR